MADISKIKIPNGTTYNLRDAYARYGKEPIETKTYINVIATSNDQNGAGFFYAKVRPTSYNTYWHVRTKVSATVPGQGLYVTTTTFDVWGRDSAVSQYACMNEIGNTSYRPIYYNSVFLTNQTGYNNDCGNWIGTSLYYSTNPTNASYKRTIVVDLLAYENCTVEMQDSLVTPTNIPNRAAHTNWYVSTNTSYTNYDACSYGLKQSGDANSTSISNLYHNNGYYIADSVIYRYQLLFQKDENTLTPLNNANNVVATTKTMLTDVEFDPFGQIYYYYSTTVINAAGNIAGSAQFFAYNGIDLRYTFNCGTTLTANKSLYLIVTPTTNGKCKIASATPLTHTLPSSEDGKWYVLLGRTYSTYQFVLYPYHPVYAHDGTTVRMVLPGGIITGTAAEKNVDSIVTVSSNNLPTSAAVANYVISKGYTTNRGTVTSVITGIGLTGGPITESGTIKAKLRSEASLAVDSEAQPLAQDRVYPVVTDLSGYLAVNVPWVNTRYNNATSSTAGLMSAEDKAKLDALQPLVVTETQNSGGGTTITISGGVV